MPGARARLPLKDSSATMFQTGDTAWTLDKTGAVNVANSTVTWTVTATEGATVGGRLMVIVTAETLRRSQELRYI